MEEPSRDPAEKWGGNRKTNGAIPEKEDAVLRGIEGQVYNLS